MISIVGGGPIGCYSGYLLAKKGYNVRIFEEHKKIGAPVACTGILTSQIKGFIKPEEPFLINTCTRTKVYSPKGKILEVKIKPNYVFDRQKFDQHIASLAENEGAKIYCQHRFSQIKKNKIKVNNKFLESDYIIGADGPNSSVAKSIGIYGKREMTIGVQARIKTKCEPDLVEFWLGRGQFGWLVPENESIARLGVISYKNAGMHFNELQKTRCPESKILEWQSGIIPVYDPKISIQKNNVRLIGDAAAQVKATTFGGILFGMKAARHLAIDIKNYETRIKKNLNKELKVALKIRKMLDKFSKEECDELISLCEKAKVKKILENHDRDYPSKMLFKLMVAQPNFLKFIKKII
ncbi:MAG: NAD(P)/FAD-dependent oxidoreductase [Nanoarchaeota archaeon]|nr:NAD(P)/FAD-dependent oxidoreductase [Nanoarchaeota archaeon]